MKKYIVKAMGYQLEYIKMNSCVSRVRIIKDDKCLIGKNIYKGIVKEAHKKQERGC